MHLMLAPRETVSFVSPRPYLNVSRGEADGNISTKEIGDEISLY